MKRCSNCSVLKPFSNFFRDKATPDGYRNPCKSCMACRPVKKRATTLEEAFLRKVPISPADTCWEWTGNRTPKGYGTFTFQTKDYYAHRVAWELHHGPIPDGLFVCHHCDTPSCVNWLKCLFLGTNMDNILDSILKGRNLSPLRPDEVRLMRKLRRTGQGLAMLADRFHVSTKTVSDICAYKRWKHL